DPTCDKSGNPLPGKSCNVLIGKIGNETHLFLCSDPRFIPNIPQVKKGGSLVYCAPGSFVNLDGEDGTITEYIPVPGNKAHILTRGLDGQGRPFIAIEHCDGMAISMMAGSLVLKSNDGGCYLEIKNGQIVVNGNTVLNGGATIGSPAGARPLVIAP